MSVQQVLEEALSTLLRNKVELVGAGRTDAGVHARQMFAHFDYPSDTDTSHKNDAVNNDSTKTSDDKVVKDSAERIDGAIDTYDIDTDVSSKPNDQIPTIENLDQLSYRLNAYLPEAIAVQSVRRASSEAHARFDAIERTYEYWIIPRKNPFYSDFAHYVKHPLDIQRMNEAAEILLHHEDFECFSKSNTDVKTYRCDIRKANWEEKEDKLVFTISADRFLRNMVRAIVGTLVEVGLGKWTVADVKSIINSKDRSQAGPSVPAKGLYLTSVRYPETIFKTHG